MCHDIKMLMQNCGFAKQRNPQNRPWKCSSEFLTHSKPVDYGRNRRLQHCLGYICLVWKYPWLH